MASPLNTEIGVTRFFGQADIGTAGLTLGWATPEDSHNWNDGIETSLLLALPVVPTSTCLLTVEARPHLGPNLTRQEATLYFNGYRLGYWRLDRLDGFLMEAEIEPEQWLKRKPGVLAKCTWHIPYSTKPSELAETRDNRVLGLCFQSMIVSRLKLSG